MASDRDKWPNGRVPYVLSAAYSRPVPFTVLVLIPGETQRAIIAKSILGYNQKTCIRFVPKTAQDKDYVVISKLDG